jgi:hypothetical protein
MKARPSIRQSQALLGGVLLLPAVGLALGGCAGTAAGIAGDLFPVPKCPPGQSPYVMPLDSIP